MTLRIAFNYGGRTELLDAARRLVDDAAAGRIRKVDEDAPSRHGCTTPRCPTSTC